MAQYREKRRRFEVQHVILWTSIGKEIQGCHKASRTDTPVRAGSQHGEHGEQVVARVHAEARPARLLQTDRVLPPDARRLHHRPHVLTLQFTNSIFAAQVKQRSPSIAWLLAAPTHMSPHLLLQGARVAELAHLLDALTRVAAVLPDDVVPAVRRAHDVGPVKQSLV